MTNFGSLLHGQKFKRSEHWGRRNLRSFQPQQRNVLDLLGLDENDNADAEKQPSGRNSRKDPAADATTTTPLLPHPTLTSIEPPIQQSPVTTPKHVHTRKPVQTETPVVIPPLTTLSVTVETQNSVDTSTDLTLPSLSVTTTSTTSSSTKSKTSTTSSIPRVAPTTTPIPSVIRTQTITSTSRSSVQTNAANTSAASSASTGAIVGGVAGGIIGLAVLVFLSMFLIKKYRQHKFDKEVFDGAFFRSAVLLNDPSANESRTSQGYSEPPTMVQRYDDAQPISNAGVGAWGAGSAGLAAGMAGYGTASAYHQHQNHTPVGYDGNMYNPHQQFSPGQILSPAPNGSPYMQSAPAPPPKPHGSAQSPYIPPPSAAYGVNDVRPSYQGQPDVAALEHNQVPAGYNSSESLPRQNLGGNANPASYVELTRVAASPVVASRVQQGSPESAVEKRPATVYDEADVYGGI